MWVWNRRNSKAKVSLPCRGLFILKSRVSLRKPKARLNTLQNFRILFHHSCAVEKVAKRSCHRSKDEEKSQSAIESQDKSPLVKIGMSYDMGWRKRCRSQDSSSGMGSAIGLKTGKVVNYATRNTMCCICQETQRANQQPRTHDCRRNHEGLSKSMEGNAAV